MVSALLYIQEKYHISHRDIKPQNVLVDQKTNKIKLCDFGSAKKLVKGQKSLAYICSRYYRAPELIFGSTQYDSQIDVWSMGCVIGEFTKEFELVHSCQHENIMKIYSFCIRILDQTTYALYVLMELSEGDWDKEIKRKLKQRKN